MRKTWCVAIGAIAVAGAVLAPATAWAAPAAIGPPVDTTTTFTVAAGDLTITAPASANLSLGSGAPGTTVSGPLGTVTVTDNRALLTATWTASASSTDFTTGGGTSDETIPVTDVSYTVGTITHTGTITPTASDLTPMTHAAQPVVTGSAGVGDNTASWDPTISVALPDSAVGGVYTGTITHSVA